MITLVLRVVAGRSRLRGTASHVATGESRPFASASELWSLLEEWTAADGITAASAEWLHEERNPDRARDGRGPLDSPPTAHGVQ